jgi:hypothetical protein
MTAPFRDDSTSVQAAEREAERLRARDAETAMRNAGEVAAFDARARKLKQTGPTVAFLVVAAVVVVGVIVAAGALYVLLRILDAVTPTHG